MRIHSVSPSRIVRALLFCVPFVVAAGCGGGGASSGTGAVPISNGLCDPGTAVQLARPSSGQFGVSTGTGVIEIVANGNSNNLYSSYTMYDVILQSNFGQQIVTSPLNLTSDPGGPKPYASDYYYSANLNGQTLQSGATYSAYLNIFNSPCQQPFPLGSFST
ncbi:hypothetical protein WPS_25630 [Vulcanimicrobium alpinum]|uniref:Uncharacterized protein n=1 Tax=Vulcanimicrobium alpinum TaxID=3016050 RepID=A0AAN2CB35_UNVUL|nr:hypothetical protein [Vulcanimicrobium alpinum]BDE07287.1 hypothetical protein WPS_25630 [Vulcanimicrobium alpinum]